MIDVETKLDIYTNQEITTLKFDTDQFPIQLLDSPIISGLRTITGNTLVFDEDNSIVNNQDVISVVNGVKNILKQGPVTTGVVPYYIALITALLEVGSIYSSFVEILFANMFLVDYDKKLFWRYHQDKNPSYKLGDKMMASFISNRIGLLYQPNKKTIEQINLEKLDDVDLENLTIYEKIYLGRV